MKKHQSFYNFCLMRFFLAAFLSLSFIFSFGQNIHNEDSLREAYNIEMRMAGNAFSEKYYPNRPAIYSLNEIHFLKKIDSLKQPFLNVSLKYMVAFAVIDKSFIAKEQKEIEYFFDRMILDYPYFHRNHTGKKIKLSRKTQAKLDSHSQDFNDPSILSSKDFKGYVEAFLRHKSSEEVNKEKYKTSDNKRLDAYLNLIQKYFTNQECKDYWQYHYLLAHLDEWGSKNAGKAVTAFVSSSKNTTYSKAIDSIYKESVLSYNGHVIKTYKIVDGYQLDLHVFLPDTSFQNSKRPVMVYFSGGSWTKGTPEWDFYNCKNYAKNGWVAVAVEYRVADRHETTPFEAVKDARSAIRWIRKNTEAYNIDSNRIVVSGNSAGGHLALATALANDWNESTDNLNISAAPNLLLINSGVYDLLADESTDWISRDIKNKNLVKKISPRHLLRNGLPPMLIIHGTNDQSVDYKTAKTFTEELKQFGNEFEFKTIEGAPHYIWYDKRFSREVANIRKAFLKKYGYE